MSDDMHAISGTPVSYLQQLQLTKEPFAQDSNSNQDEFFLLDTERAQRINMLYHMSQNSELLLVVTGIEGSGKTSLLNRFIEMRTENWRQCVVNANTMTNPDQLLIEIAEGFGLPQDTVTFGSGLEMLQKRLTDMKLSELMPILIIDDAHELPTASLTILLKLSELSDNNERLLRIVLFAEPIIMEMFDAPELKEVRHRITHTLTMPSLTEQQSIDYIQYRLSVAGLQGDNPFSQGQMKRIHRQANGVPGLINKFAQEILLGTTVKQHSSSDGLSLATRLRSLMSIFLILGIAGLVTWYLSSDVINSLGKKQTTKLETRELPLLPPSLKVPRQDGDAIVTAAAKNNTDKIIASTKKPIAIEKPLIKEVELVKKETTVEKTPVKEIAKQAIAAEKTTDKKIVAEIKPIAKPVVSKKTETKPTTTTKTVITKKPAAITKPTSKPVVATKPATKSVVTKKPAATTKPTPIKKDWLTQQNKNHFTLQIMGSGKRSSLALVQKAHKIGSQSAIIRTDLKGKDWFILIYKAYPTKQQARNAANILPSALRLTKPWPRRLGDIKSLK
ncbi:MAG: AAA family ATPase [Sulfuriflexus sp.]|nr:AAA family ATPase [Sulfuriflexus sp.]